MSHLHICIWLKAKIELIFFFSLAVRMDVKEMAKCVHPVVLQQPAGFVFDVREMKVFVCVIVLLFFYRMAVRCALRH